MSFFTCRRLLLLVPLLLLLASCSEDFKVAAPYKPITIVYGLMDISDTAHYIRVQKAYLDEHGDARVMAQIPDSNFYDSLVVHLREKNGGTVVFDEVLQRVDLNKEGYRKDSGIFFRSPNYAYKTKRSLNPNNRYQLLIENRITGQVDSAETGIIANSQSTFRIDEFIFGFSLDFPAVNEKSTFSLSLTVPPYAQLFEGIIRFHYVDKDRNTGIQTDHTVDWNFASSPKIESRPGLTLAVAQRSFYPFLRSAIPDAPANIERYMDTAEVFIWAADQAFATYQQINGAQGGLTADQIRPIYTNIQGKDVYGLFASRTYRWRWAPVTEASIDSLKTNATTRPLNFRGRSDH